MKQYPSRLKSGSAWVHPGDRDNAFAEEKASLSIYQLEYRYI